MTADVEQTQSNGSDRMAPILYRPVPLPVPRVARRGVIEAGREAIREGGQIESNGEQGGQIDMVDGMTELIDGSAKHIE